MEILRKITIRNCGWAKAEIMEALREAHFDKATKRVPDGKSIALLKIVGETTQAKTGQTDTGEYVKLVGDFFATNLVTGEAFQSGHAILPNFVAEVFAAALHVSQSVEFAVQIDATAKADSAVGYEFSIKPLMQSEPTAKMSRLLKLAGIDLPKLAAPKADPEPEGGDEAGDGGEDQGDEVAAAPARGKRARATA